MKVVIYARVSSGTGRQDTDRQVQELRQVAGRAGYEVLREFCDFKSGALPNSERQYLQNCMEFCADKTNEVGCVMVTEVSRLGRDPWEMMEVIKYFHDIKVNLYFRDQNLAMLKKDGTENELFTIMFAMYSSFAKHERTAIQQRLESGYKQFREKGGKVGRKVGYRKSDEQMEEEYKEAIKLLKKGTSMKNVAKLCGISESTVLRIKRRFGILMKRNTKKARSMEDGV